MSMWTKAFWRATTERALKTAAQSAILVVGADQVDVIGLDFATLGGFAAGGALLSVLTSVASVSISGGPSMTDAEHLYEPRHDA